MDSIRVKAEDLFDFCLSALKCVDVKESDERIISENPVLANLRGVDFHGVTRLPVYVKRVLIGYVDPHGPTEIVKEHGATALLDAHNNFGQARASIRVHVI